MKSNHQVRIEEFMRKAGQDVPVTIGVPNKETRILRARLMTEELLETIQKGLGVEMVLDDDLMINFDKIEFYDSAEIMPFGQAKYPSLHEIMDGCGDLSVTTIGTLSACGCHDLPILKEVDKSNLAKFGPGSYKDPKTGKWIKPPNHKPADMTKCVLEQKRPIGNAKSDLLDQLHEHLDYDDAAVDSIMMFVEDYLAEERDKWIQSISD